MTSYIRNPLSYVWAFLTAITIASWAISQGAAAEFEINAAVTVGVLLIAAVKAQLVIRYFMEVQTAPAWLKKVTYGWNIALLIILLGSYSLSL